jgi:hypothetical protein
MAAFEIIDRQVTDDAANQNAKHNFHGQPPPKNAIMLKRMQSRKILPQIHAGYANRSKRRDEIAELEPSSLVPVLFGF